MVFHVAQECKDLGLRAGAVVFRGVQVGGRSDALRAEIAREVRTILAKYPTTQAVRALPEVALFQEMLRKVGVNPRKLQPSVERLLTFAQKRSDLPRVNSFVDAYNLVSIRSLCSLGGHDLDRIALPITLRFLAGQETFTPLGGDGQERVAAGEFGYVDAANRVVCRLDVRQAEFSKVTADTVNALLIIEGTARHSEEGLRQTVGDVIEIVTRYCGGIAEVVGVPITGVRS